jgi:hypothetical protein
MTVMIKCDLYASWYDERLREWYGFIEWDKTWFPRFDCANKTPDAIIDEMKCDRLNDDSAQMLCWLSVNGAIYNVMNLRKFPFDCDAIEIFMDASNVAKAPEITELDFRPVSDCNENRVADYNSQFGSMYDPVEHMLEFTVTGLQTCRGVHMVGQVEFAQVNFMIHVVRKPMMMVMKVVFPLFLCGILSLSPTQMDPITDYIDRINYAVMMFLATSAFLFVIEAQTPTTPYMKTLDYLIGITVNVAMLVGLETMIIRYLVFKGYWECDDKTSYFERDDQCSNFDEKFADYVGIGFVVSFVVVCISGIMSADHMFTSVKSKKELHDQSTLVDHSGQPVLANFPHRTKSTPAASDQLVTTGSLL